MGEYTGPDPGYSPVGLSQGNRGLVLPDPNAVKVVFFTKPKELPYRSKTEGRPIWENQEYVSVLQPGEKSPIVLEAHDGHRQRWKPQYEAFLAGKAAMPVGTPLTIILPGQEATVNELNGLGVFTVEQMAGVSDSVVHRIPFGGEMKVRAQRYLDTLNGAQGFNKVQAELDKTNAKNAEMERELAELKEQMASMAPAPVPAASPDVQALIAALTAQSQTPPPARRGRPPKAEAA